MGTLDETQEGVISFRNGGSRPKTYRSAVAYDATAVVYSTGTPATLVQRASPVACSTPRLFTRSRSAYVLLWFYEP